MILSNSKLIIDLFLPDIDWIIWDLVELPDNRKELVIVSLRSEGSEEIISLTGFYADTVFSLLENKKSLKDLELEISKSPESMNIFFNFNLIFEKMIINKMLKNSGSSFPERKDYLFRETVSISGTMLGVLSLAIDPSALAHSSAGTSIGGPTTGPTCYQGHMHDGSYSLMDCGLGCSINYTAWYDTTSANTC